MALCPQDIPKSSPQSWPGNRTESPWCLHAQAQLSLRRDSAPRAPRQEGPSLLKARNSLPGWARGNMRHRQAQALAPSLPSSKLGPSQRTTSCLKEGQDSSGALLAGNKAGSWGCSSWEDCRGHWGQSPASKLSPSLPRTQRGQSWPTPDGKCPDQGLSRDKRRGRDKSRLQRVAWFLHICSQEMARGVCVYTWRWG